jgi:hypothetical protein
MSSLQGFTAIIIPGWIYRAINKNKLNIIDVLNYSKIRSVLSIDDMAELVYMNDQFQINGYYLANTSYATTLLNLTPAQKAELDNSVRPLSLTEEIATSAKAKLTLSNRMSECVYQFVTIDNNLFVILNEGFLTSIQNDDRMHEFVKLYLKECYAMTSIKEVSTYDLFKLYLSSFSVKPQ